MAGFFRWERKRRQLLILKRQAEQSLETADLPKAETPLEKIYQEIIQDQEKRCQREQRESREKLVRSREYYTRWSHQIKTPIAAMELLLQEEPADVRALKRELLKTSQYVEMALSYQRMEGDGNDLVIQRYELRPVVMQAVKKVSPLLIHKHISFSAGDLSGEVLTDEKWLVFVLEQLLTNASKYTKEGGSVWIGKENGLLVLRDTGIGIRPEDLPRIFEWGYTGYNGRLDKRSTRGWSGTGEAGDGDAGKQNSRSAPFWERERRCFWIFGGQNWRQSEKRLDAGHWQRLFLRRCKKWKKKCKQKPWQSISSFFILYL